MMTLEERATVNDLLRIGRDANMKLINEKKALILALRNLVDRTKDAESSARLILAELDK